jgi:hypothetical protein
MIYVKTARRCFSKVASSRETRQKMQLFCYTRAVLKPLLKQALWFYVKLAAPSNCRPCRLVFRFSLKAKQLHSKETSCAHQVTFELKNSLFCDTTLGNWVGRQRRFEWSYLGNVANHLCSDASHPKRWILRQQGLLLENEGLNDPSESGVTLTHWSFITQRTDSSTKPL